MKTAKACVSNALLPLKRRCVLFPTSKPLLLRNDQRHVHYRTVDEVYELYARTTVPSLATLSRGVDGLIGWYPVQAIEQTQTSVDMTCTCSEQHQAGTKEDEKSHNSSTNIFRLLKMMETKKVDEEMDILPFLQPVLNDQRNPQEDDGWIHMLSMPGEMCRRYEMGSSSMRALMRIVAAYVASGLVQKNRDGLPVLYIANNDEGYLWKLASDIQLLSPTAKHSIGDSLRGGHLHLCSSAHVLGLALLVLCGSISRHRRLPSFIFRSAQFDTLELLTQYLEATTESHKGAQREDLVFKGDPAVLCGIRHLIDQFEVPSIYASPQADHSRAVIAGKHSLLARIQTPQRKKPNNRRQMFSIEVQGVQAVADAERQCFTPTAVREP